jgi:hypothetical protein
MEANAGMGALDGGHRDPGKMVAAGEIGSATSVHAKA